MTWNIVKLCNEAAQISVHHLQGRSNAQEEFDEFIAPLRAIKKAAYDYYAGNCRYKFIRDAVSLITELTVQQKLCSCFQSLYKSAEKCARDAFKRGVSAAELKVTVVPGGSTAKLVEEKGALRFERNNQKDFSNSSLKSNPNSATSIEKNLSSTIVGFIKENRVPKLRETFLVQPEFIKTNYMVKGAKVLKKDGYFYHLDTVHRGKAAHIEVYGPDKYHIGTADPITGIITTATKKIGRRLKTQ